MREYYVAIKIGCRGILEYLMTWEKFIQYYEEIKNRLQSGSFNMAKIR